MWFKTNTLFIYIFKSATLFNIILILFIYIPIHIFYIYFKTLIFVLLYAYILLCLLNCNMLWSATNEYGCGAIPNKYIIIISIVLIVHLTISGWSEVPPLSYALAVANLQ